MAKEIEQLDNEQLTLKKTRTEIPAEVAAEMLFLSDRTCCVCRKPNKPVQIHHIDGNPSNSAADNLAVLCFDCHHLTQLRGGFDRKLDAAQVFKYRADWLARVASKLGRTCDEPTAKPKFISRNLEQEWKELQREFKKLHDARVFAEYRPDYTWKKHEWVIGPETPEFDPYPYKAICTVSGKKLMLSQPAIQLSDSVRNEGEHWIRWLWFLREKGRWQDKYYATTERKTRMPIQMAGGVIENLAKCSAEVCFECSGITVFRLPTIISEKRRV